MPASLPVLIAGAGPTGLVAAAELTRRGIACRLFEKHETPLPFARASGIQARLVEVLDVMGTVEPFLARGTRQTSIAHVWNREVVASMSFTGADSPYNFILGIGEGETIAFLTDHLTRAGVEVERSLEVASCEQQIDRVRVEIHRADGHVEQVDGSYLICCDGMHSAVREQLGDELEGFDYPTRYRTGVMQVDNWPFAEEVVVLFDDESCAAQTLPDDYRIVFDSMDGDDGPVDLSQFQELLDTAMPGRDLLARDPQWMAAFVVHDRFARTYRVGRVFVAGDAAHTISPINGQGMNLGIDDAYNLAWKLSLVIDGTADESLLDTYQSERRPLALACGQASDEKHKARSTRDHAQLQAFVDASIAACNDPEIVHTAAQAVGMLDTTYVPSVIARDQRSSPREDALAVGSRLPTTLTLLERDGSPTSVIRRLWDGGFRVLVVRPPTASGDGLVPLSMAATVPLGRHDVPITTIVATEPDATAVGDARAVGDVVFEPAGRLHRSMGFSADGVVIVRPDGYIGFAADLSSAGDAAEVAARFFADLG